MKYIMTTDIGVLRKWLIDADYSHLVWDTETFGLRRGSEILGISFYDGVQTPIFAKTDNSVWDGIHVEELQDLFLDVYLDSANGIGHNMKYDVGVFKFYGLPYPKRFFDTLIAAHLIDSEQRKQLEIRALEDLDYRKKTFTEVVGKKWEKINFAEPGMDEALAHYSCEDSFVTYKLFEVYEPELREWKLERLNNNVELPLIDVLAAMYERGVRIDMPYLKGLGEELETEIETRELEIYSLAGCTFNLDSPKQKAEVLFDKMGYPTLKVTKKGGRSTDAHVLEALSERGYPIATKMVEYSELNKLNSGFVQAIPKLIYPDGRLRADFNSSGTTTGRFSSQHPNLQNQPNNEKYSVRSSFVPAPGYGFIVADYSQIELRVMAHASKDPLLVKTFLEGGDIHGAVANALGISRKHAKIVNFGILYGMGKKTLSNFLKISEGEAERIINRYHYTYKGYSYWSKKVEEFAAANGYIRTIFGRVRKLPHASFGERDEHFFAALRQAVNTSIQGAAADLIKIAMVKWFKDNMVSKDDCFMLLQVHDELVFESRLSTQSEPYYIERMAEKIDHIMSHAVELIVPTPVDVKIVPDWGKMKLDSFPSMDRRKGVSPIIYTL